MYQRLAARDPGPRHEPGFLAEQKPEPDAGVDQDGQPGFGAERRLATGSRSGCEPNASPSMRRRSASINSDAVGRGTIDRSPLMGIQRYASRRMQHPNDEDPLVKAEAGICLSIDR